MATKTNLGMTLSDIRQIVSYLGAAYSMEVFVPDEDNPDAGPVWQLLEYEGANLLLDLFFIYGGEYPTPVRNFKLKLRSIAGLSDEEIRKCLSLAFPELPNTNNLFVYRDETCLSVNALMITLTGNELFSDCTFGLEPIDNPGAIISYLQSIAVFVPGTLNPDFVTLI